MLLFSTSRFVKLKICKIAVKMLIRGCQTHVKCNVQYSIWKGIPNPQFRVQCSSHRNLVFNSVLSNEIINIQILFVKFLHSKMNFPAKQTPAYCMTDLLTVGSTWGENTHLFMTGPSFSKVLTYFQERAHRLLSRAAFVQFPGRTDKQTRTMLHALT